MGRGLSSLLESPETDITSTDQTGKFVVGAITEISIEDIETNPFQPRTTFEDAALRELAESISKQGIIQPITVRKMGYDKYQLISGERRFRASQLAGLTEVPAYIRIANDQQMLEMSLVENIQRENLNAIEIAISFQRLIEECSLTQDQLSVQVGKNRTTISNYLRLLKLPADIQYAVRDSILSMGHARAIINVDSEERQLFIFNEIVTNGLSVRETEKLVREMSDRPVVQKKEVVAAEIPGRISEFKAMLSERLSTGVEVKYNKGKGSIVIPFSNESELEKILEQFKRS